LEDYFSTAHDFFADSVLEVFLVK